MNAFTKMDRDFLRILWNFRVNSGIDVQLQLLSNQVTMNRNETNQMQSINCQSNPMWLI